MNFTEHTILRCLQYDEEYCRAVLPFLKLDYFSGDAEKAVFNTISSFVTKYNNQPTKESLIIDLSNNPKIVDTVMKDAVEIINQSATEKDVKPDKKWLLDNTESFCQDKALYLSLMQSIMIADGKDKNLGKTAIPQLLTDALAVNFDTTVGHDYLEDWQSRYDIYHQKKNKIPFHLEMLNTITGGGLEPKTLNVILAGTGVGKTLALGDLSANYLLQGHNVLYITLEMAAEKIAARIDANLLDIPLSQLEGVPKPFYEKAIQKLRGRLPETPGKIIIREYPPVGAHVGHFRALIRELRIKKKFVPKIIAVDYLNLCLSMRYKLGANINMYSYIKSVAEELRGLAVEYEVPIISATQTNRAGFNDSDVGMDATSESFGLPMTVDFMLALITTDELAQMNQILAKQLKNRYGDVDKNRRFVLGIDKPKMRLYDVAQSAQVGIMNNTNDDPPDDVPAFDRSKFANKDRDFSGFKV